MSRVLRRELGRVSELIPSRAILQPSRRTLRHVTAQRGFRPAGGEFDGTNDYFDRGADLTGLADGKKGIISFWTTLKEDVNTKYIIQAALGRFQLTVTDTVLLQGKNSANTAILIMIGDTALSAPTVRQHFLMSWDLSVPTGHLFRNDADDLKTGPTFTDDTLDYVTATPDWGVGATSAGVGPYEGCMWELYFNSVDYLDFSIEANRRKFISAAKDPVFLGNNGELVTGSQPILYFSGVAAEFSKNLGSGGVFNENGALTDCQPV